MRSTVTESLKPLNKYFFPLCAGFVLVVSAVWDRFPAVDVFFLAAGIFLMFLPYEIKFLLRALQPLRRRAFDFRWFSAACLGIAMIGVSLIGQMDGVSIAMLTVGLFLGIFPFFLIDSRHGGSHPPKFPYSHKIYIRDIVMVSLG